MTLIPGFRRFAVALFLAVPAVAHAVPLGVIPPAPDGCTATTTTFANTTPTPIPDLSTISSTINVSGVGSVLWDLNMKTSISHTNNGNLAFTLTSPAGTVMLVSFHNGTGLSNIFNGTVWDDDAGDTNPPGAVTINSFQDGVVAPTLVPEGAMDMFAGEDPNGTWTLTISDTIPLDTGTLNDWSLEVTTLPAPPGFTEAIASTSVPVPIPDDGTPATSTINFPPTFSSTCSIRATTTIAHDRPGDLIINLISPAGTIVSLANRAGKNQANVFDGTVWRDDAPNPAAEFNYVSGVVATPLQPEEAMGAFTGEDPTGTWTLYITDNAPTHVGTIDGWQLTVRNCTCSTAAATALRVDEHAGSGNVSNLNGVFEPGETVQVEPSWVNPSSASFGLTGVAQNFTGPSGPSYTIPDSSADYGTVASLATANCFDQTANCYGLAVSGLRPAQHWDATFDEVATPTTAIAATKTWTLHIGGSFPDVPVSQLFYKYIENLFHNGVTGGCGGGNYCPDNSVTRGQMAVFLLKSARGSTFVPPACAGVFPDVPCPSQFANWIEELFAEGITGGCGGGNYCPNNPVTRAQMAVFLLKAEHGSVYTPPACTGVFADVACPSQFANWIEQLFHENITGGCGGGNYCPTNSNTRGQMAVFLVKTFGLLLYGP